MSSSNHLTVSAAFLIVGGVGIFGGVVGLGINVVAHRSLHPIQHLDSTRRRIVGSVLALCVVCVAVGLAIHGTSFGRDKP